MARLVDNFKEQAHSSQHISTDSIRFELREPRSNGGHYALLHYDNRMVNIERAVIVGSWILCLEKASIGNFILSWALGGFEKDSHYTFQVLEHDGKYIEHFEEWLDRSIIQ